MSILMSVLCLFQKALFDRAIRRSNLASRISVFMIVIQSILLLFVP